MAKIDKRKRYGIILDTETANTIVEENGKLCMNYVLPYDFGFAVIDTKGNIYEKYSFINSDIFCNELELMQSAYYSKKIPRYIEDLSNGKRTLSNTYLIRQKILELIKKYNCRFVMAHNARFDLQACNNIQRWTTKSKYRYFFPKNMEIWDSLKASRAVIAKMPTYQNFCKEHGYMTKHKKPQVKLTAETLYKFITKNTNFSESHTGLEDVLIELEIYKYCKRQKKKMQIKLF